MGDRFNVDVGGGMEALHRDPDVPVTREADEGLLGPRHVHAGGPGVVLQGELQPLALLRLLDVGEASGQPRHGHKHCFMGMDLLVRLVVLLFEEQTDRQHIVELHLGSQILLDDDECLILVSLSHQNERNVDSARVRAWMRDSDTFPTVNIQGYFPIFGPRFMINTETDGMNYVTTFTGLKHVPETDWSNFVLHSLVGLDLSGTNAICCLVFLRN